MTGNTGTSTCCNMEAPASLYIVICPGLMDYMKAYTHLYLGSTWIYVIRTMVSDQHAYHSARSYHLANQTWLSGSRRSGRSEDLGTPSDSGSQNCSGFIRKRRGSHMHAVNKATSCLDAIVDYIVTLAASYVGTGKRCKDI